MKKTHLWLILALFTFAHTVYALPQNLTCAKRAIIHYYDSGDYEKDVNVVVNDAEKYLQKRIRENVNVPANKKWAIVLDIDDTSLNNFLGNKKRDFSSSSSAIEDSFREANAPAIRPTLRIFNEAVKNNIDVFFISFRPNKFRSDTIKNLKKAGYSGWKALYLPNEEQVKLPAERYKTAVRKMLTAKGYDIILSMGDQNSDLIGGYADHVEKIPNPLYSSSTCDNQSCA